MPEPISEYPCPAGDGMVKITTTRQRRTIATGGEVFHSRECQKAASRVTMPCGGCGEPVTRRKAEVRGQEAIYHDRACRGLAARTMIETACSNCGRAHLRKPSEMSDGPMYCSRQCFGEGSRSAAAITTTCAGCKTEFTVRESARIARVREGKPVYHSRECQKAHSRVDLTCSTEGCENTFWRYRTQLAAQPENRAIVAFCDDCVKAGKVVRRRRTGTTEPCGICGVPVYKRPVENTGKTRYCSPEHLAESMRGPRAERPIRICLACEEPFSLEPDQVRQDVKTCSRKCTGVLRRRKPGERYVDDKGYVWITTPDGRNMFEHRYKMEVLLADILQGQPLPRGTTVHHVNLDKSDNTTDGAPRLTPEGRWRSGNLELWVGNHPSGQRLADLIRSALVDELEEYRRRFGPLPQV